MKNERQKKNEEAVSVPAAIEALFQRFQWLNNVCSPTDIKRVVIRLIDVEVIKQDCGYRSEHYRYNEVYEDSEKVPENLGKKIHIFDKDGKGLGVVGKSVRIIPAVTNRTILWGLIRLSDIPSRKETTLFQETVEEAINRFGIENAHYLVSALEDAEGKRLIFCHPGNKTIKETLEAERKKAEEQLTSELSLQPVGN